ncbi:MAG: type III secretion system protein, YseE family [Glomeribacter sp. 1016415]|nr:type III secretion system protein, YseE family [Glomeribacter sp. 1016415]
MGSPVTQLEERLLADQDGVHRTQLAAQLEREKNRLQRFLRQSCPPAQYRIYKQQYAAVEHAQTVIDAVWRTYHRPLARRDAQVGSSLSVRKK